MYTNHPLNPAANVSELSSEVFLAPNDLELSSWQSQCLKPVFELCHRAQDCSVRSVWVCHEISS